MIDSIANAIINKLFYNLDYNKKIKDFYCINDKMVTPSSNPKIEKNRRGRTFLSCKCEKCGNNKRIYIPNTWNIYEDEDEDEDEEKNKINLKKI